MTSLSPSPGLILLFLFACGAASGQQAPRWDLTADFKVPEGLAVTLWAESPRLHNPTAMDVDVRGRLFVTEAVNYRKWDGRNPGLEHPEGDRVVILEDADGDGRCDSSKVFVQDRDLVAPLGICVQGNRVFVSCSPHVFVYTDENGDDVPERREVFLTGFGGFNHDHGVHSLAPGPDGRLYFNAGNAGPHLVRDHSGWMLRSGSLYVGGGPKPADNKPGLISDDGRVWTGGIVLRVRPDGTHLTPLAHNFRNPYEVAVDAFGDVFQSDNDDDGNESCRTVWVMEGGNYGFFSPDGSRTWQADRRPGQPTPVAHWRQDDPGVCPSACINGGGGPTGVCIYEGGLLPARFMGAVLDADAGRGIVYAHHPRREGAGVGLTSDRLLEARRGEGDAESRTWFRPSDVLVAPDGSVFVADWYDPGVGGHLARDSKAYGRILRIAPRKESGRPFSRPDPTSLDGALRGLESPAPSVRFLAFQHLLREGERAIPGLEEMLRRKGPRPAARALWLLARLGERGRRIVSSHLHHPDPRLRITALRALRSVTPGERIMPLLREMAGDEDTGVLREVALAARDLGSEKTSLLRDVALAGLSRMDRWLVEAVGIGAEGVEADLARELIAACGETGRPAEAWPEPLAFLLWRLHPEDLVPQLARRARAAGLDPAARRQALDALAFIPSAAAADAMLNLALSGPEDLRSHAVFWVRNRSTSIWRSFDLLRQLGAERISTGSRPCGAAAS